MSEYRGRNLRIWTTRISYSPGIGTTRVAKAVGRSHIVKAVEVRFRRFGWDVNYRAEGKVGVADYTIRTASNPENTSPIQTQWGLSSEIITQDLFQLPKVATEANGFAGTDGPEDFRQQIEKAVRDGDALTGSIATSTIAQAVWNELRRGADSYETEALVLTRTQKVTANNLGTGRITRPPVLDNSLIYSTGNLANSFSIPAGVLFNLPDDPPDALANARWGWRISEQSLDVGKNFTEFDDALSFQFAAWSTFYYTWAG